MSLRPGSFFQPDSVSTSRARNVAPQRGQLTGELSVIAPHHWQVTLFPEGGGRTEDGTAMTGGGACGADATGACTGGGACQGAGGSSARLTCDPQDPQKFAVS